MKTYKWLRGILKTSALTTVMFVMQACYGAPHPIQDLGVNEEEELVQTADTVNETNDAPQEMDDAANLP